MVGEIKFFSKRYIIVDLFLGKAKKNFDESLFEERDICTEHFTGSCFYQHFSVQEYKIIQQWHNNF